ncbi:hypothetical protein [Neptunomonas japonica]|uniref:hypothetical protein n=1 Tax=Neptunomonas japonica TaxID=417574 RepID=UPI00041D14B7|nr:hypothetical protein [Neptunomonas japonica]
MRKWLLIFLLLANVITFFGFVMTNVKPVNRADVEIEQAFVLRLVSEVAEGSLQKRPAQKLSGSRAGEVLAECIVYEGLGNQSIADAVAGFMVEQGLSPTIIVTPAEGEKFQLVLSLPKRMRDKLLLVAPLRESGILVTPRRDFLASEFVIAEFLTQAGAQDKLNGLLMLAQRLEIKHLLAVKSRYSIQLSADIDRNLINKINDVLQKKYKSLKIVKKPC